MVSSVSFFSYMVSSINTDAIRNSFYLKRCRTLGPFFLAFITHRDEF